ncbi:MAG: tRNA epoxyqueuosine(34) reductase QueG [Spirochaetales bacterium]|jgi:epoxyqueuosine reductase|nr:tRNA epoxyqueuosine(34) reductase QueG [Spirochaetales bacterium]
MNQDMSRRITELFSDADLEVMGTTATETLASHEKEYQQWLASGFHGSMKYLERHEAGKYRPDQLLPGARTIIFTGLNYYQKRGETPSGHGQIAHYAWGRDYHKTLGNKLKKIASWLREDFPQESFLPFADTTPLSERTFAANAGVGFIGRNTLLIRRGMGSWLLLGGILTTASYTIENEIGTSEIPGIQNVGCPSGCTRCIDACPTDALFASNRIDASRCISYLTIEHKGEISEELYAPMGSWIFGCDICQDVCPFNKTAEETKVDDFLGHRAGSSADIVEILSMQTDEAFTDRFAGSPLMRAKREGMIRNALVTAVNLKLSDTLSLIKILAGDDNPVIRESAIVALEKMLYLSNE